MSTDLTSLIGEHAGISFDSGRAWCTCGKLLWTVREGFVAGNLPMIPGKAVGEIAHIHHLAAVIEESEWLREQRAQELEAAAEKFDQRSQVVERRHVAEALRARAQAIREGREG